MPPIPDEVLIALSSGSYRPRAKEAETTVNPTAGSADASAIEPSPAEILRAASFLRRTVRQITNEEFSWQDEHYNRDSRYGRETLFLIADSAWIRATSEDVDISRSDAIDTTIKVELDLSRITHEAFYATEGKVWLPLLVLPLVESAQGDRPSEPEDPDPFTSLTVSDAHGALLPTTPMVDVRHWIAAALAEIIVNMASARWASRRTGGQRTERPIATRDQRLVLSAAIHRLLWSGSGPAPALSTARTPAAEGPVPRGDSRRARRPDGRSPSRPLPGRMATAKQELIDLLNDYITDYRVHQGRAHHQGVQAAGSHGERAHSFGSVLTQRAVQIIQAFIQSVVVVVPVDRAHTPTVLTVRVPPRRLHSTPVRGPAPQRAELSIDLLLPSADADRQVQINLPDGVSLDSADGRAGVEMIVEVAPPQPLKDLGELMDCLTGVTSGPPSAGERQALADLAAVKADLAADTLRQHLLSPAIAAQGSLPAITQKAHSQLIKLRNQLGRLSELSGPGEPQRVREAQSLRAIGRLWDGGRAFAGPLRRRVTADALGPRTIVGQAGVIEDITQRPTTLNARIDVRVEVSDADFFSIARFAGVMSVILMGVVLAFLIVAAVRHRSGSDGTPSPEVLAGALTLFSAIQAGRVDRPDRSTLRGMLSAASNWLIVGSVLPTVVLAVAVAFNASGWTPVWEAMAAIGLQGAFQLVMSRWRPLRGARATHQRRRQVLRTWPPPDYARLGVLRSHWWRNTTADALKLGRQAEGYVVWERGGSPSLTRLLVEARQPIPPDIEPAEDSPRRRRPRFPSRLASRADLTGSPKPGAAQASTVSAQRQRADGGTGSNHSKDSSPPEGTPANVLALLRGTSAKQALTFIVFREDPAEEWATGPGIESHPAGLDPDRLAPIENALDSVEVFLSVACGQDWPTMGAHPVPAVLRAAAAQRLVVLEADVPVPPPVAEEGHRTWARVRVGLRDDEIRRLPGFLHAIQDEFIRSEIAGDAWIRTAPGGGLRVLVQESDLKPAESHLVLASHMDVVAPVPEPGTAAQAKNWRVVALCADAQTGIEAEILRSIGTLQPGLHLAGLNYAVLHGTSVILMLAHQTDGRTGLTGDFDPLVAKYTDAHLRVLVDGWQNRSQLGEAPDEPLLRVHMKGPDQPETLLDALQSLYVSLCDVIPEQHNLANIAAHALTRVTAGSVTRLTVRLAKESGADKWSSAKLEEIERSTRQRAVRWAMLRRTTTSPSAGRLGFPEDTVISLGLVRAVPPPTSPAAGG
jgi:hypothetical protein